MEEYLTAFFTASDKVYSERTNFLLFMLTYGIVLIQVPSSTCSSSADFSSGVTSISSVCNCPAGCSAGSGGCDKDCGVDGSCNGSTLFSGWGFASMVETVDSEGGNEDDDTATLLIPWVERGCVGCCCNGRGGGGGCDGGVCWDNDTDDSELNEDDWSCCEWLKLLLTLAWLVVIDELDGNWRFDLSSSPKTIDPFVARRCLKMSFCCLTLVSRSVTCAWSQDQREPMALLSAPHFQLYRFCLQGKRKQH